MTSLERKLLIGVLVGAGIGFAAGLLLASRRRPGLAATPLERARYRGNVEKAPSPRKTERTGRKLTQQIERIRSAGF